jgi:hypothetical protein
MFFAATLLLFSFPQQAPIGVMDSNGSATVVDTAKADSVSTSSASTRNSPALPSAPAPKLNEESSSTATPEAILPGTGIQPANPPKAAIRGVRYEAPKRKVAWIGLSVAGHGAAAFDAYSTRLAISGGYGTESNPLLRPFAHSGALYAATQVSPTVMDYLGHKMMTNRHPWVRKMWWVPQAAGAGFSVAAGVHNMSLVK